jgi:hypothetical protein
MTLLDSFTWHVMDATADDWESLEQILPHVHQFHGPVEPVETAKVIARLIDEGLMEAMHHEMVDPHDVAEDPIGYWFRITALGRSLWDTEGGRYRDE